MARLVRAPTDTDLEAALTAVSRVLAPSPLLPSPSLLAEGTGSRGLLKVESLNHAGSFKLRGAIAALSRLPPGRPVVTCSAGNHGVALAVAAAEMGAATTIVVSRRTDPAKVAKIQRTGCDLVLWGDTYDEAERHAIELAELRCAEYVSPYNDPAVIAGQATIGHELAADLRADFTVVTPIGGGGLAAGLGLALRTVDRAVVVGVEAERSSAMSAALAAGRVVPIEPGPTLADALAGNLEPGTVTYELVRDNVGQVMTVTEDEIADAIRHLYAEHGLVVEGAGATAVAAVRSGRVRPRTAWCVAVVTGRNIEARRYARIVAPD